MSDWSSVLLGKHCRIRTGKKDVNEGNPSGHFPFFTCSRDISWSDEYSFDTEAILIAGNGDVGNLHYYDGKFEAYQRTYVLDSFTLDVNYIYQYLGGNLLETLKKEKVGTSIPYIKLNHLNDFEICLPKTKKEQQKIANILQTIDLAIEKTKALIEKYQKIKAGLMHDLFTRGITADGKLRPPREQAPELYQETAIGWIPKDWELHPCSDLCSRICVGIVIQPTQYYVDDGVPAFRSANIREVGIDPNNLVFISSASNKLLVKSQIKANDILSVRTGYPGTSAIVPEEFDGNNCIDVLISTPSERIQSDYLCNWINSSFGKEQVLKQQGGMAQQHFNVGEMRQLLVARPNHNEQSVISNRLKSCKDKILLENSKLEKLTLQKQGLMQDLLTGKVPVKVDQAEAENA